MDTVYISNFQIFETVYLQSDDNINDIIRISLFLTWSLHVFNILENYYCVRLNEMFH